MILIADSGSTNTSWCLMSINKDSSDKISVEQIYEKILFSTEGYNPYYVSQDYLVNSLKSSLPAGVEWDEVHHVGFYGAGCSESKYDYMREALHKVFRYATVDVAMDLLAAARALLGDAPGFAAILGTGTNSCIYDGCDITKNVDSLGFMLGDEGSGSYIGKRLLRDYLRDNMPENVAELLKNEENANADYIFEQVYEKPFANKYCAGFTVFINKHRENFPYLNNIIEESFRDLFTNIITHYPGYEKYSFNCVGSVGFYFSDILLNVCTEFGMKPGKVLKTPMEGLIEYYLNKKTI